MIEVRLESLLRGRRHPDAAARSARRRRPPEARREPARKGRGRQGRAERSASETLARKGRAHDLLRGFKDVVLRDVVLRTRVAFHGGLRAETLPRP